MRPQSSLTPWFRTFLAGFLVVAIIGAMIRYWGTDHRRAIAVGRLIDSGRYEEAYGVINQQAPHRIDHDLKRVLYRSDAFANYLARRWADRDGRSFPGWGFILVYDAMLRGKIERPTLERLIRNHTDDTRVKTILRDMPAAVQPPRPGSSP